MLIIKVPATTANLGPGFDTLGAALSLYNQFEVEKTSTGSEFIFQDESWYIANADNLVLKAMDVIFDRFNRKPAGFKVSLTSCEIPVSRGLGSSAAAIVAGLYAGLYLIDAPLDQALVLKLAAEMEGHPDNAVPAIVGGIIAATMKEGDTFYHGIEVHEHLSFLALVPNQPLETSLARQVLPDHYSRKDLVHNLSRLALLICSLNSGNASLLKTCFDDKVHEPYRWHLMPDHERLIALKNDPKVIGGFISGAGSTYILICLKDDEMPLKLAVENHLKYGLSEWRVFPLSIDTIGTCCYEKSLS